MHFCEEVSYRVIAFTIMQKQEPSIAWRDVCCHEQVVESVHSLHNSMVTKAYVDVTALQLHVAQ